MTCQTCGNPRQENFCPHCGEKRHDPHSLTLRHYAEETLEGFTHFDHRFFRSVRALLLKPGFLTTEFVQGRRVRYMLPLPLFLVCNLLFFFFQTNNVFNQPLSSFVGYEPYTYFGTMQTARRALARSGETEPEFTIRFNGAMKTASKSYLFGLIPVYAALLALLFLRKRRTFIEHLLFSTHLFSFLLLFFLVQGVVLLLPVRLLTSQTGDSTSLDLVFSLSTLVVLGIYLFAGFRQFYHLSRARATGAAALGTLAFPLLVVGYRMLLFYGILHMSH